MAIWVALFSALQSAKQQKDAADYQAQVDKNNATLLGYQASDVQQRGAQEARAAEVAGAQTQATARTEIAAGGIDPTSGSAANAITRSGINAGLDAARIRAQAAREAWGLKNEIQDLGASAKFRKKAGYLGALGTGLGGIGQAAGSYAASKKSGD